MPRPSDRDLAATILAAIPGAVTRCSADLRYLWASDRYAAWLGVPTSEIVGRRIVDVIGEEGTRAIRPHVEGVLAGKPVKYEEQVRFKNIGLRWIQAEYSPTFDESGVVDGWVALVSDVTEKKRAEEALTIAHAALARLLQLSVLPGGVEEMPALLETVVDTAIEITAADMGNVQLYDEAADCLHMAAQRGFEPSFVERFAAIRGGEAASGKALQLQQQVIVEDVSTSPLFGGPRRAVLEGAGVRSVQSTLMVSREGRPLGVISTYWKRLQRPDPDRLRTLNIVARHTADALEHRRQEERLREADRRKDEFLAMLGHELRNPLAPIVTATELMALRGGSFMEEERKTIERQAKHLIGLVDDLLDISRLTRGKIELRKESIPLAQIVRRAVEMASPLLERHSHRLTIEVPPEAFVEADPQRLVQVVANLLTNAAKYTDPGGQVRVSGEVTEETIVLRVADNGIGISPTMIPVVFDLFVQDTQALNRPQGGLGLGLGIVRNLVELHGGSVSVRSEGLGKGSEFTISLPRSTRTEVGQAVTSTIRKLDASRGVRILLVDDNEDWTRGVEVLLTALGHEVRVAHDGPQAFRIVEQFKPALAFLDIGLPVMDGYELARRLREMPSFSGVPLVAVSGYGEVSSVQRSAEAGFKAHLVKPVAAEVLDKVARDVVRTGQIAPSSTDSVASAFASAASLGSSAATR
jgi:PAS domain S-box-containing protein